MSAFFVILKIFGWLVLIVLALLMMLLFWPVKYKVLFAYQNDMPDYFIEVSWILNLALIRISNRKENSNIFKIGWIDFANKTKEDKDYSEKPDKTFTSEDKDVQASDKIEDKTEISNEDDLVNDNDEESFENKESESPNRIKDIYQKIKAAYNHPDKNEIISESILLLKRTWEVIKPTELNLNCTIGLDTPDKTGYMLGVASIIKTFLNLENFEICIESNFKEQEINVEISTHGEFTLFSLSWPLIIFILAEPIWQIVKDKLFKKTKNH